MTTSTNNLNHIIRNDVLLLERILRQRIKTKEKIYLLLEQLNDIEKKLICELQGLDD